MAVRIGTGDQNQQPHLEPGGRRRDTIAGNRGAQICLHGADFATMSTALVGRPLQCVHLARNQHQVQTRLGDKPGEFGADPLRAARDQRPRPVLAGVDHPVDARTTG